MLKKTYNFISHYLPTLVRSTFYRILLNGNPKVKVYGRVKIINLKNFYVSNGVTLNDGVYINCTAKVNIGNNVRISSGCKIITTGLNNERSHVSKSISISDNCWLGVNSVILAGVTLKAGTIVGAGAVVTKSNDKINTTLVGVPAREIKQ